MSGKDRTDADRYKEAETVQRIVTEHESIEQIDPYRIR